MSGGHFNYNQFFITEIAEEVAKLIRDNNKQDEYGHSRNYSQKTIEKFIEAENVLKLAEMMAQRIDFLVSCDDDENSFHERWDEELRQLNSTK